MRNDERLLEDVQNQNVLNQEFLDQELILRHFNAHVRKANSCRKRKKFSRCSIQNYQQELRIGIRIIYILLRDAAGLL